MRLFSSKKKILNIALPLILALIFFSMSQKTARRAAWYESAMLNALFPFIYVVNGALNFAKSGWKGYVNLTGVKKENDKLKKEVSFLEAELIKLESVQNENERLRSLTAYQKESPYPALTARVIANDPQGEFKSVVINAGLKDGVDLSMPVVGPKGLVGRVGRVYSKKALVLLITDPNSTVDVMVERSRVRGFLVGKSKKAEMKSTMSLTRMEYLERSSDVKDGDVVVTSGFDGLFPPLIPVGTLHEIVSSKLGLFEEAEVVPYEDLVALSEVMVILTGSNDPTE